jgi:hypothetical protein
MVGGLKIRRARARRLSRIYPSFPTIKNDAYRYTILKLSNELYIDIEKAGYASENKITGYPEKEC